LIQALEEAQRLPKRWGGSASEAWAPEARKAYIADLIASNEKNIERARAELALAKAMLALAEGLVAVDWQIDV
jgi:hypothetical protein